MLTQRRRWRVLQEVMTRGNKNLSPLPGKTEAPRSCQIRHHRRAKMDRIQILRSGGTFSMQPLTRNSLTLSSSSRTSRTTFKVCPLLQSPSRHVNLLPRSYSNKIFKHCRKATSISNTTTPFESSTRLCVHSQCSRQPGSNYRQESH